MFDNLKKAFSDVSKGFSEKELKENDIDEVLFQLEISLLESDVACLLYTSPSPRDGLLSRMPSSA